MKTHVDCSPSTFRHQWTVNSPENTAHRSGRPTSPEVCSQSVCDCFGRHSIQQEPGRPFVVLRVSRLPACRQQWVLTALPTPLTLANRVRACYESSTRRHHRVEMHSAMPLRRPENTQLASTQSRSPLPHLNHQADRAWHRGIIPGRDR